MIFLFKLKKKKILSPHLLCIQGHGGQVVGVLLVPGQPQQGHVLLVLVDDGGVLQVTQVKHAH